MATVTIDVDLPPGVTITTYQRHGEARLPGLEVIQDSMSISLRASPSPPTSGTITRALLLFPSFNPNQQTACGVG
jgi:hypothetical protein